MKPSGTTVYVKSIYTDGSGIEGKIGAAAFHAKICKSSLQHLGSEAKYNVFAAELAAMCLSAAEVCTREQRAACMEHLHQ